MRARIPGSRLRVWLLMDANRTVVAGALLAVLFAVFVVLGVLDPAGVRSAMGSDDPIETAFQALVTAIVTGVTLVVTINQLVLSQELGAVADQRERMAGAMEFRLDVEDVVDAAVAPADPGRFLQAIVDATAHRAEAVRDAAASEVGAERRERIDAYVDSLTENARSVRDRLEGARFGTFEVLLAALDYNYSWKIYEARRLQQEFEDVDAVSGALEDVVTALEFFGPAREHVKTLYFQWELIDLSRAVLYAAVPALVVAIGMILYVDNPASVPGSTLGVDNLVWLVSAAVPVALLPFALLFSYILRIATVTKRTLAIGPFVLRETDRTGDLDGGGE
ncbi:MAG TPA: hypothetical protein VKA37_11585 [Halobacteriales archaeon]|nr:hypothetical protein [Halobacteriales archaeon]